MSSRFVLALLGVALGCDQGGPSRPPRPLRRGSGIPPARVDASASEAPGGGGDAAVPEVIARCVERTRASIPEALREGLGALDEPSLLDSSCRLELAPRMRAPWLCEGAALGSIRALCVTRSAMTAGAPERCPGVAGSAVRDPVCVAIAARDLALCAAAGSSDRARCEAIGAADPARCARLDPLLRAPCERELRALRGILPTIPVATGAASSPSIASLRCGEDGGSWSLGFARRGVYLDPSSAIVAVPLDGRWPAPWRAAEDDPVLSLRVPLAGRRGELGVRAEGVLILPRLLGARSDDGSLDVIARILSRPQRRGDRVRIEVSLRGAAAGASIRCELSLDTFVRDLVSADAFMHHPPR